MIENMENTVEFVRIEMLFNAVEQELARRWVIHNVPAHFTSRSVESLRKLVKAWWQIYHESICAGQQRDRTEWERKIDYPTEALDTSTLLTSLEEIHRIINLGALLAYRSLHPAEEAAIILLAHMASYYAEPFSENVRVWIQIL